VYRGTRELARVREIQREKSFEIIGGTISSPVAYPLLQRSERPVCEGILHPFDSRVEMNPILAHATQRANREADSLIGAPRLTYCQPERQIPAVVSGSGAGWDVKVAVNTGKSSSSEPEPGTGTQYQIRAIYFASLLRNTWLGETSLR